jgi:hypothetical protein
MQQNINSFKSFIKPPWQLTSNRLLKVIIIFLNCLPVLYFLVAFVGNLYWMMGGTPGREFAPLALAAAAYIAVVAISLLDGVIILLFWVSRRPSAIGRLVYFSAFLVVICIIILWQLWKHEHPQYLEFNGISYSEARDELLSCNVNLLSYDSQPKIASLKLKEYKKVKNPTVYINEFNDKFLDPDIRDSQFEKLLQYKDKSGCKGVQVRVDNK